MNTKAHVEWKSKRAGLRARIVGIKPTVNAPASDPRAATLARIAQATGNRQPLGSILAEAASIAGRWA